MGSKIPLLGPHLMEVASHELSHADLWVEGKRHGEGVVWRGRVVQTPVVKHEHASLSLEGNEDGLHDTVWGKGGKVREKRRLYERSE